MPGLNELDTTSPDIVASESCLKPRRTSSRRSAGNPCGNDELSVAIQDTEAGAVGLDETDSFQGQSENPMGNASGAAPVPRNEFSTRKTAAHAMMDVALMMANISQLRVLLTSSPQSHFHSPLLHLIITSLVCQVLFAFIIVFLWARQNFKCSRRRPKSGPHSGLHRKTSHTGNGVRQLIRHFSRGRMSVSSPCGTSLDESGSANDDSSDGEGPDVIMEIFHCFSVVLVFFITVVNMFITGLGLDSANVAAAASPPSNPNVAS